MTLINIFTAIAYVFLASSAPAQIIYVDADASVGGDGSSWNTAYQYLQDALAVVAADDEIRVAEGTYQPDRDASDPNGSGDRTATFQLINGVTIKGGYPGLGAAEPDARDISKHPTILSGDLKGDDESNWDPSDLINEPNRVENCYHVVTGNFTDPNTILDGFTITGGQADFESWPDYNGAGMYNDRGQLTVINCTFKANAARYNGGGMFNYSFSSPTLTNCTFSGNYAQNGGGMQNNLNSSPTLNQGIFKDNYAKDKGGALRNQSQSNATITNYIFSGNWAKSGGGTYNQASDPTFINSTFSGNRAHTGGGMYNYYSSPVITNSIFWGDTPDEIHVHSGAPTVTYSNVQGGSNGLGNLDTDPRFVSAKHLDDHGTPNDPNDDFWVEADYHLQSYSGQWDPNFSRNCDFNDDGIINLVDFTELADSWCLHGYLPADLNHDGWVNIKDLVVFSANFLTSGAVISRCIDAGNPGYPLLDEPSHLNNVRINMGAYGQTDKAGKTPPDWALRADINNDGTVNLTDFNHQARVWLKSGAKQPGDLNRDGIVDIDDLELLSADWLKKTSWR
ncbi:hypothetical protein ACFL02_06480 [Planctomycetota bacterium]